MIRVVLARLRPRTIAFRYAEGQKTEQNLHLPSKFHPPIKFFGQKTFKNTLKWPFYMLEKNLGSLDWFYKKTPIFHGLHPTRGP